ncbi:uncharacterized protein Z519_02137 [Cladophialophora bantiana CBS 173.52]|uniref:Uncharacterized protein n=1 Tax=Cladophialophora bantiana (strain ATCC 10958 / CBS 173.52 / CDC B-1940 / NIH 8579) TaxID=1442370 RepID=A0A0D2F3B5_CLAB1|nr:uncharacterized protein Z519_02137 [Cladophialophora bantiana CBS 173.52]KIW96746.1 hypothetical protein Z519_02137 [Cladophialophora bantiana CBS 173.52]
MQRDPEGYVRKVAGFRMSLDLHSARRHFAVTRHGYIALVPQGSRDGDVVVILDGAQVPSVLRRCEDNDETTKEKEEKIGVDGEDTRQRNVDEEKALSYRFVGECYVHGVMNGELIATTRMLGLRTSS